MGALLLSPAAVAQIVPQANPQITALPAANTYQITWPGENGRLYFIQFSTDLQTWTYAPAVNLGTGAVIPYGFSASNARSYFRLKYSTATNITSGANGDFDGDGISNMDEVALYGTDPTVSENTVSGDADGDGLPNIVEVTGTGTGIGTGTGTNPSVVNTLPDADNDGLRDATEVFYFGNTTAQTGTGDADGDGLPNIVEVTGTGTGIGTGTGTDPSVVNALPDADNDGLRDATEVYYFGNTAAQNGTGDADGDGISNMDEVNFFGSDPAVSDDTDQDGYLNSDETAQGSNPADPASKPFDPQNPPSPNRFVAPLSWVYHHG